MDVGFVSMWVVAVAGLACLLVVVALVIIAVLLLSGGKGNRDPRQEE